MDTHVEKINFLSFNLGNFKLTYDPVIEKNIVVKRFVIHEAVMLRLRKKCIEESSGALTFQPSRVEIITTLLWRAYIRASATINGYVRPSLMALPLNLRAKTSLPQVHNSMGKDVSIKFILGETKKELHNYIILIRNIVNKVIVSCTKVSPDEIVSTLVNSYNESFEAPKWGGNDEVDKVACSSLCNFRLHDTDFGMEKPTLLLFGMKDIQMFWWYDTSIHSEVGAASGLEGKLYAAI